MWREVEDVEGGGGWREVELEHLRRVLAWSLAGVKDNCLTEITAGDLL